MKNLQYHNELVFHATRNSKEIDYELWNKQAQRRSKSIVLKKSFRVRPYIPFLKKGGE